MANTNSEATLTTAPGTDIFETFEQFGLLPEIADSIGQMGFKEPTPVQSRCYAAVVQGKDAIVMAQTGTGKTAAFGIPIVQNVEPDSKDVQALVLTPTRELALQVSREIDLIGQKRPVRCVPIYGGASFNKQIEDVKAGAHTIAGTPGRILDHMRRRTIDLSKIKTLVLDEADEMLSMGFEREISEIIEQLPTERQTLLFSATIPDDISRLSKRYMREATVISVSGDEVGAKEVSHYVYLVSGASRTKDLTKVLELEKAESAIVFCNTKDETQLVAKHLQNEGFGADWLNSDLSQSERERVMSLIRNGTLKFLVATDVAARGIDISHIDHVINFTFPESLEVYIHRTGRTGRMGRKGAAISLITPQDIGNLYYLRLTYKIFPVEKSLPNVQSTKRESEIAMLSSLRSRFAAPVNEEFLGLSRRLVQDAHVETIIAGLLEMYFAGMITSAPTAEATPSTPPAKAPQKSSATPKKAPKKAPAPSKEEPKVDPRASSPFVAPEDPADSSKEITASRGRSEQKPKAAPKPEPAPKPQPKPEPKAAPKPTKETPKVVKPSSSGAPREIYIDGGRKDGLKISSIINAILERTDTPRDAIGRIRLMSRSTFVAVATEHFNNVLRAIDGMKIEGHVIHAEAAEES